MTREWISLFFSVSFLLLIAAGIFTAGAGSRVSLRRLMIAARLYAVAIVAEAAHLVCKLAAIPSDGWLWVAVSAFNLACAVVAFVFTRQRRELKAEQVAERIIHDWLEADQ